MRLNQSATSVMHWNIRRELNAIHSVNSYRETILISGLAHLVYNIYFCLNSAYLFEAFTTVWIPQKNKIVLGFVVLFWLIAV
jgi:hypothetical protein